MIWCMWTSVSLNEERFKLGYIKCFAYPEYLWLDAGNRTWRMGTYYLMSKITRVVKDSVKILAANHVLPYPYLWCLLPHLTPKPRLSHTCIPQMPIQHSATAQSAHTSLSPCLNQLPSFLCKVPSTWFLMQTLQILWRRLSLELGHFFLMPVEFSFEYVKSQSPFLNLQC